MKDQTYTRLTARYPSGRSKTGKIVWRCDCACGGVSDVVGSNLVNGHTKSCGCLSRESKPGYIHGGKGTPTYVSWKSMRNRCNNKRGQDYALYGGRGIGMAPEWDDFKVFRRDMGERPAGLSLERKDTDGDYTPTNCVWATQRQQCNNKRNNRLIECEGVILTLAQWGRRTGINQAMIQARIDYYGWSVMKALVTPARNKVG